MSKYGLLLLLCLVVRGAGAQSIDSLSNRILSFPSRLLGRIQSRTADLNRQLTRQTEKMLTKMARQEARMERKVAATDSLGARQLFGNAQREYTSLLKQLHSDSDITVPAHGPASGVYLPYVDSLKGAVAFLGKGPGIGTLPPISRGDSRALPANCRPHKQSCRSPPRQRPSFKSASSRSANTSPSTPIFKACLASLIQ